MFKNSWKRVRRIGSRSGWAFHGPKRMAASINYKIAGVSAITLASAGILANFIVDFDKAITNDMAKYVTVEELLKHNKLDDCWILIHGKVYDVTTFLESHPGGAHKILEYAGKDATEFFDKIHGASDVLDESLDYVTYIGSLIGNFPKPIQKETTIPVPPISTIFNLTDFEDAAKLVLPKALFYYYHGGASDERTLDQNFLAYTRVFFKPRILRELSSEIKLTTEFLGEDVELPVYITAFAGARFAHDLGELNLKRAANKFGVMQMVPKKVSFKWDEFFQNTPLDQKHWFQLHFEDQAELDRVERIVKKMETFPSVKGIFINVDLQDLGNREKDVKMRQIDNKSSGVLLNIAYNKKFPSTFSWKDIDRIQKMTRLPIALKGIQNGEDVVLAAQKGIKAVVISNHGGRQLDYSRPPLEVLVEAKEMLAREKLDDKIEIYIDGGIRRGSDVIKALCLGAKGVGLGRPFIFAMAGYGQQGVERVFEILQKEMINNMKLLGVDDIKKLNASYVDTSNLKFRYPKCSCSHSE